MWQRHSSSVSPIHGDSTRHIHGEPVHFAYIRIHPSTVMTDLNKYNPYPLVHTIRCPKCGGPAVFHLPFRLLHPYETRELLRAQTHPNVAIEQWGGWQVSSYFPDLYPWKVPPTGSYQRDDWGVCH